MSQESDYWNNINWNNIRETILKTRPSILPPYTEDEVNKILSENEIQLPHQLYNYLTKVSRQILYYDYPSTFKLMHLPNKKDTSFTFKSNDIIKGYINYEYFIKDKIVENIKNYKKGIFKLNTIKSIDEEIYNNLGYGDDDGVRWYIDSYCKDNNINKDALDSSLISIIKYTCTYYTKLKDNFVLLEDHGCDSSVAIFLGEGEYYGSVWHIDQATDSYHLEYGFFNYYIKNKFNNKTIDVQPLSLKVFADNYNTLRIISGLSGLRN
jgi:hypothetical protein